MDAVGFINDRIEQLRETASRLLADAAGQVAKATRWMAEGDNPADAVQSAANALREAHTLLTAVRELRDAAAVAGHKAK